MGTHNFIWTDHFQERLFYRKMDPSIVYKALEAAHNNPRKKETHVLVFLNVMNKKKTKALQKGNAIVIVIRGNNLVTIYDADLTLGDYSKRGEIQLIAIQA
jgi:hypothetical protein